MSRMQEAMPAMLPQGLGVEKDTREKVSCVASTPPSCFHRKVIETELRYKIETQIDIQKITNSQGRKTNVTELVTTMETESSNSKGKHIGI